MSKTYEALRRAEAERAKKQEESPTTEAPFPFGTAEEEKQEEAEVPTRPHKNRQEPSGPPPVFFPTSSLTPTVEEQCERIHAKLLVRPQKPRIQTIMLVGTEHRDGVTTVATLFARVLAKARTVLLVDANLRTPALADIFRIHKNGGLADFLARKVSLEGAVAETDIPNLFVMTSGSAPFAPPYLFETGSFDELLAGLRERFHYIVCDAAPLGFHLDSVFLASRVDGVILVVKAEYTGVEEGKEVKARLEEVGAPLLGVIVNQTQTYVPAFLRRLLS